MQSIEALERLNTNLQIGGRKDFPILQTMERITNVRQSCNTWNVSTGCRNSKKKIHKRPSEMESHERRNTVASLAIPRAAAQSAQIFGGQFLPITSSALDYEEVAIPEDSVIYCDIPYEDTNVYNKAEGFDYERFYQWCERQTQPVFISSYQMPEDRFDCIEEFTHRSTLSATANNLVTERIYVPKHQAERGNRIVQLTLF